MNKKNIYRLKLKQMIFLKLNSFHPQVIAPMETRLTNGVLANVGNIIDAGLAVESRLNVELCNAIEHKISEGYISKISNGWNNERFTFIMVVEVFDGNTLIAEEIYQGYSSDAETTMGSIERGGSVSLDPSTILYINKVMNIIYRTDEFGNKRPVIAKPSNVFTNHISPTLHDSGFVLNRPSDLTMKYYANEMSEMSNSQLDIRSDLSNYNGTAKLSKLSNESSGSIVTSLIKAADTARRQAAYQFSSENLSNYEGMLDNTPDESINDYYTLRAMGEMTSRISVSNFTIGELKDLFKDSFQPLVATLTSYNDIITRNTNQVFKFNGLNDRGDEVINDNQITRFQKKVIPFIFDKMMSLGYIMFSGVLTNKTPDGRIAIQHSLLRNISSTINNDNRIYNDVMRLLYESLTSEEATRLISGGKIQQHDVEMIFDLDINNSVVEININGNRSTIRIPSMADSVFSSIISTEADANVLGNELRGVVDSVLKVSDDVLSSKRINKSMWD